MEGYGSVTRQFILNENTPYVISDTYGKIRANLMSAINSAKFRSVVITSQCREEGKTTTAINLAIMISRLDKRVLLIDADMRRPAVHDMLRLKNRLGLSSILNGDCDVYSGINADVRSGFHVITSGPAVENPADLLGSSDMERLIGLLYGYYDYIIIDTPPLCIANDAMLFGSCTGGLALVVREGKTTHRELKTALSTISLSRSDFFGIIKTHCRMKYKSSGAPNDNEQKKEEKFDDFDNE